MQRARIRFTPVPLKARHDGWTPARQRRFIEVLAATWSVSKACGAVGMSRMSAYKLRDHPDAREFRSAWRMALEPDCTAERPRQRKRRKVDKVHEMHGPPYSRAPTASALQTLETYLALLRSQYGPPVPRSSA